MLRLPLPMISLPLWLLLALAGLAGCSTLKGPQSPILLETPWIEHSVEGRDSTQGYFQLTNRGEQPDQLLEVKVEGVRTTQLHEYKLIDDQERMVPVPALALLPNETVTLSPKGYHLLLFGLQRPLEAGEKRKLTLRFEKAGVLEFVVPVTHEEPRDEDKPRHRLPSR